MLPDKTSGKGNLPHPIHAFNTQAAAIRKTDVIFPLGFVGLIGASLDHDTRATIDHLHALCLCLYDR